MATLTMLCKYICLCKKRIYKRGKRTQAKKRHNRSYLTFHFYLTFQRLKATRLFMCFQGVLLSDTSGDMMLHSKVAWSVAGCYKWVTTRRCAHNTYVVATVANLKYGNLYKQMEMPGMGSENKYLFDFRAAQLEQWMKAFVLCVWLTKHFMRYVFELFV